MNYEANRVDGDSIPPNGMTAQRMQVVTIFGTLAIVLALMVGEYVRVKAPVCHDPACPCVAHAIDRPASR